MLQLKGQSLSPPAKPKEKEVYLKTLYSQEILEKSYFSLSTRRP